MDDDPYLDIKQMTKHYYQPLWNFMTEDERRKAVEEIRSRLAGDDIYYAEPWGGW